MLLIIVLGGGIGVINESGITQFGDENTDPSEPTVTVTPPATETPRETATPTSDTGGKTTATETATPSEISGSIAIDASAPEDVKNGAGKVIELSGEISGTASWEGSVDSAVVIVSSWSPEDGWSEIRRTTVSPTNSSLALEEVFKGTETRYVTGQRAKAFTNPHEATTLTRTGYIGVTVVLFEDSEEKGQLVNMTEYSLNVTNVGSADVSLDLEEATSETGGAASDNVAPGATGYRSITLENAGSASGTLRVFLTNVTGSENGFADAEAAVDDDQDSELLEQLQLRIAVVTDNGRNYLLGGPDEYAPLTRPLFGARSGEVGGVSLPAGERRAVVVEWWLPESAGNEVMTDTVGWDLKFVLESDGTTE
ncbi:MAG: hypothetical protein V5A38_10925 [Halolamina sp.]